MYLFKDQEEIEISINCKLCLKEIKFTVSVEEYKNITKFPIKKESIHGTPQHRLVAYISKNLDIENFKIEEMEPSRVYLTGTVTYLLFFVLFWEVVIMLTASQNLLPPGSL